MENRLVKNEYNLQLQLDRQYLENQEQMVSIVFIKWFIREEKFDDNLLDL